MSDYPVVNHRWAMILWVEWVPLDLYNRMDPFNPCSHWRAMSVARPRPLTVFQCGPFAETMSGNLSIEGPYTLGRERRGEILQLLSWCACRTVEKLWWRYEQQQLSQLMQINLTAMCQLTPLYQTKKFFWLGFTDKWGREHAVPALRPLELKTVQVPSHEFRWIYLRSYKIEISKKCNRWKREDTALGEGWARCTHLMRSRKARMREMMTGIRGDGTMRYILGWRGVLMQETEIKGRMSVHSSVITN